jgi:hypothetical protein
VLQLLSQARQNRYRKPINVRTFLWTGNILFIFQVKFRHNLKINVFWDVISCSLVGVLEDPATFVIKVDEEEISDHTTYNSLLLPRYQLTAYQLLYCRKWKFSLNVIMSCSPPNIMEFETDCS